MADGFFNNLHTVSSGLSPRARTILVLPSKEQSMKNVIPEDHPGLLIIRLYVASHDDQHRGGLRTLARIPCKYGEAPDVLNAWRGANSIFVPSYNSPIDAQFHLGSVHVD
jgi:hypothetical protein